ncbi:urease accessory protein UreE [Sphingobacterium thalpophilum]|uniref:Urease accessory protein UreE n=1 Tax=Sphingobacterium thalpophilum TaxID=259 RepID=A0ABV4HB59_9SPHI|nr:urease accessory protein UreE [Sphingobacterium thalpophilum]
MILASDIKGNIRNEKQKNDSLELDFLELEWFDTEKRVIRGFTVQGREIGFRNLGEQPLFDGDILFETEQFRIVVRILPCPCLVVRPKNRLDMARICLEIGNKHIPIFINAAHEIIAAYENPLWEQLHRAGFTPVRELRVIERTHTLRIHQYAVVQNKITLAKEIRRNVDAGYSGADETTWAFYMPIDEK